MLIINRLILNNKNNCYNLNNNLNNKFNNNHNNKWKINLIS